MTRTTMPTRPRAGATFLGILAALFLLFSLAPARAAETDDVLAKARALVEAKRYDEAAALLDPVISADPKDARALSIRAEARRLGDRPAEARADYARVTALEPADADAWFWLGTLDRWHSRDKDAIYEYGRVLEVSPCHLDALKGRARSKRSVGNSRGAEADLREALRCGPGDEEAAGLLADLLADHGDLEGAQKVAAEEFSGPEVEKRLGDAALAAGQPGEAARHYRKALEAGETAETLRALGEAERQRGDDVAALDAHRRASRLDREGTGDLYWIGVLASRLGYRDEAKQAWDAILAKHPADSGARVGKARILRSEGDRAGALKLVEDTLRDDPENGEALVLRGQLYSSMGRTEAARKDYRAELERHPDDGDARILLDRLPDRRAWGIGGNYDRARVVEGLEDEGLTDENGNTITPARVEYLNAGGSGDLRWTLGDRMALVTEISLRREAVFGLGPPGGPAGRSTIYDFDVLGAAAGLDQTLSDLWSLTWRAGGSRYSPRSEGTISTETHLEGEARLARDDGRTRLDFLAARDSFIWRGYAGNTQFRIFDRDRLGAKWERSLHRGLTATASAEVAHFDDGNTPFFASAGLNWERGRYGASLHYRHDPFPARFLNDMNELDFIAYDALSLGGSVALPLGFRLSAEALAGRYGATKPQEIVGDSLIEGPPDNNTQRQLRGTLAWTPHSFKPLSLGAEYFWDHYAFHTGPYNTNNTHATTLFAEVAGDAGDRWHYVARYDHGTIGDRRSPHYTANSYFARVEARLGDPTREAGPIRLGVEARYRENGLDEDWNHCLAFLTVPF